MYLSKIGKWVVQSNKRSLTFFKFYLHSGEWIPSIGRDLSLLTFPDLVQMRLELAEYFDHENVTERVSALVATFFGDITPLRKSKISFDLLCNVTSNIFASGLKPIAGTGPQQCYRIVAHQATPILSSYYANQLNFIQFRPISNTSTLLSEKSCPKIKEAIEAAKIQCQKKNTVNSGGKKPKKSIKQKIIDELKHYYYGFKLLGLNTKISFKLAIKKMRGIELTRRENNLFIQTVADLFRLIPFSAFVIVPFLEFTLPIFIKFFPGMLPTTFETKDQKEAKLKQSLKMKLKMAAFLQETLDNMSVCGKGHTSEFAKEFADFFAKVRKEGVVIPADEMLKFSKLFKDEITLDSLPRPQLVALCRVLEIQPIGTSSVLKYLLTLKLRSLIVDDRMIQKEGVDSLTMDELQDACKSRGMGAYGLNKNRLKEQLTQWLDLSLNERVPPLLLLLSRAFSLTPNIPTSDLLKKAISALPYCVGESTEADLCERCGTIDNKSKFKTVEKEERMIKAEIEECMRERKMQLSNAGNVSDDTCNLVDKAPVLTDKTGIGKVTLTDLKTLECAIENLCSEKNKLIIEKSKITELKTELNCYQTHLNDLQGVTKSITTEEVKESEAAKRLFKGLNKIITDIDQVFKKLEKKELVGTKITIDCEYIKIDELITVLRKLQNVPDENKIQQIIQVLSKIDSDHDGLIKLDILLKVLHLICNENMNLSIATMDMITELVIKEECMEKSSRS